MKQLGDGVMLAFHHVGDGIRAVFRLRAAAAAVGLPALHIGISAGRSSSVTATTSVAPSTSRPACRESPVPTRARGRLVDDDSAGDLQVTPLGPTEVKGLRRPIELFRLRVAADGEPGLPTR